MTAEEAKAIDFAYFSASGNSFNDCAFLGQRFLRRFGYEAGRSESWVIQTQPVGDSTTVGFHPPSDSQYSGLWRSPAGVVYVSDATLRCIRVQPDIATEATSPWKAAKIPFVPQGIWAWTMRLW